MPISIQDRTRYLLRRPPRPHPYAAVRHDSRGQYIDFKIRPDLIETALEDFAPHNASPGIQEFYAFIRHVNSPGAPFETTDCGLSKKLFRSSNSPFPDKAGWVGGRVMVMWRELDKNCRQKTTRWLLKQLLRQFRHFEKKYDYIGFVVGPFPTLFRATGQKGHQIDIEFAMWGDEVREAMERFPDVVHVLERSIKKCEANCRSAIRAKPEDVVG
jgi:hypothetical protein